jgi:hypothetical protein
LDFLGIEPDRGELAAELVVVGAGVGPPVILVEIDQDIEHAIDYTAAMNEWKGETRMLGRPVAQRRSHHW